MYIRSLHRNYFLVITEVSTYEKELTAKTLRNNFNNTRTINLTENFPAEL